MLVLIHVTAWNADGKTLVTFKSNLMIDATMPGTDCLVC
jgi:hypothetical protein